MNTLPFKVYLQFGEKPETAIELKDIHSLPDCLKEGSHVEFEGDLPLDKAEAETLVKSLGIKKFSRHGVVTKIIHKISLMRDGKIPFPHKIYIRLTD